MKVCVAVHGRFHAFELAAGLARRGALARLLSTYPGFLVSRLIGERLPVRSAWWLEARRRLLPGEAVQVALATRFGHFAATHLPAEADLLVGWSAATLEAIEPARRMGMKVVIERGSTHIAHQTDVLTAAYDAHGLDFNETPSVTIQREEAEYDAADAIAVPTRFAADTFTARGIPAEKLLVAPYGVDLARFRPGPERPAEAPVRILFVGRVGIRKGVPKLLRAFEGLAGTAELHLIGPVEPAMEPLMRKLPTAGVTVHGAQPGDKLPAFYANADAFCLPSLEEGFPLVLLQALASGLPVVTTPEAGAADIVTDGVEGLVVPAGDGGALGDALAALVSDAERRRAMGVAARARIEAGGWSWDDYVERVLANYRTLVG